MSHWALRAGKNKKNTSGIKGTTPTLVIAKGSFQPSQASSTQPRALLVPGSEGQNGNYFLQLHTSLQRAEHGQTHVERCHLCRVSFGKKVWVMAEQGKVGGGLG